MSPPPSSSSSSSSSSSPSPSPPSPTHPLSQPIMLITDQEALSRLARSLRIDIEILLNTIHLNPDDLDEAVRSHFLQAIFSFLRHATDLTEETVRNNPLFGGTTLAAAPTRYVSVPPIPHLHPPGHYHVSDEAHLQSTRFSDYPPPPESSGLGPFGLAYPRRRRDRCWEPPTTEPHSLWFPNAPPTATPALLAEDIIGGPLEGMRWFRHYHDNGLSFLINFLDHKAAASFLEFTKTPTFQMRFPGVEKDWRPFITWSNNTNMIRPTVLQAAKAFDNPARRVIVFHNFPATVTKSEMKKRLKALERQCMVDHWVDTYEVYPSTGVAYFVFSKIESAMRVMGWYNMGCLGPELNNCEVIYGRDPSDRPIPNMEDDVPAAAAGPVRALPVSVREPPNSLPSIPPSTYSRPPLMTASPPILLRTHPLDPLPAPLPTPLRMVEPEPKLVDAPVWVAPAPSAAYPSNYAPSAVRQ